MNEPINPSRVLELRAKNLSDPAIARILHCGRIQVLKVRWACNFPAVKAARRKFGNAEMALMLKLYDRGLSDVRIAREMHCDRGTVAAYRAMRHLDANCSKKVYE